MIRRDFDLEEMKYFLHLVGQSTDDYLYILDLTNDKAVYSKSITNVFALDSEEFSNAMQELVKVVHPDDIDMLTADGVEVAHLVVQLPQHRAGLVKAQHDLGRQGHKKSCQTIVALPQTTVWQAPIIYLFLISLLVTNNQTYNHTQSNA